ncbi:phosphotransferase family protein [Nocardia sp. CA-120079]|uniref:phosphotransferase family protein n=1 Tax=Nocardia sp. CA-120079 TaxID=3239974 RepID=UPI003D99EDB6
MMPKSVPAEQDDIDLDAVAQLLVDEAGVDLVGPLHLDLLSGGRSNLTYVLTDGMTEWVLRRPPLGHVLATAHDMGREVRVQLALGRAGFPVPRILLSVAGPPVNFYVMERIRGCVLRSDADLIAVPFDCRGVIGEAFIDTLSDLHRLAPDRVGLTDFGRPIGFLERQLARWSKQLAASRSRTVPGFDELVTKLATGLPTDAPVSVVHGDYRLDNTILDVGVAPRVRAVLDWEMSTLGDPLSDVGMVHMFWEGWRGIDNPIAGTPGAHPGYPSWDVLAARYEERSGRRLANFSWYQAYACFKLAVILEGIHYRHSQGVTVGTGFEDIGGMVEPLVDRGLATYREH